MSFGATWHQGLCETSLPEVRRNGYVQGLPFVAKYWESSNQSGQHARKGGLMGRRKEKGSPPPTSFWSKGEHEGRGFCNSPATKFGS